MHVWWHGSLLWSFSYLFAYMFFSIIVFKDYEVKKAYIKHFFSLTFMFSIHLFLMLLLDLLQWIQLESIQIFWTIDLMCLAILLTYVLPFLVFYTIHMAFYASNVMGMLCASMGVMVYLMGISFIGYLFSIQSTMEENYFAVQFYIQRLNIIGVTWIGSLSGFGAVNMPYQYLSAFWTKVSEEDIDQVEERLQQTIQMVFNKKKRLYLQSSSQYTSPIAKHREERMPWWKTIWNNMQQSKHSQPGDASFIQSLRAETIILEKVVNVLFLEVHELRSIQRRFLQSKTLKGRARNVAGYFLTLFCAYKMFMGTINIIFYRDTKKDPITVAMERILYVVPWVSKYVNIAFLAEMASLGFVGILVFSQTRGFLITLLKVFRAFSTTISSNTMVLWLTQIMGTYFLSSFLLMRRNLPTEHRKGLDKVLGNMDFYKYHRWFDQIFIVSASLSFVILFVANKSKKILSHNDSPAFDTAMHAKYP